MGNEVQTLIVTGGIKQEFVFDHPVTAEMIVEAMRHIDGRPKRQTTAAKADSEQPTE